MDTANDKWDRNYDEGFYMPKSQFLKIREHLTRQEKLRASIQKEIDTNKKKRQISDDMVKDWSQTIQVIHFVSNFLVF